MKAVVYDRTLGWDVAGVVDDVGPGVTRFLPGDEVYGDNLALKGGFAEYALAPVSALADKPAGLTSAEASTIPQAGASALQGVRTAVAASRVLINGAGGGSGSFAIQLCAQLGAHVTGVDNAAKQEFMRSAGVGARWQVSVRGRVGGHTAESAHRRCGGREIHRAINRGTRGERGASPLRAAGRFVRGRAGEDLH